MSLTKDGFNNQLHTRANSVTDGKQFDECILKLKEFNEAFHPNAGPPPPGKEIALQLRMFQSILLEWVKESYPCFNHISREFNHSSYPAANYEGLYETLLSLIEKTDVINDTDFNDAVVSCLACVLPFLCSDTFLSVPITLAECLYDIPAVMQAKVIDILAQYIIPFIYTFMTEDIDDEMAEINLSVPSILSSVLDGSMDASVWTKLMECLMRYKRNVSIDLLTVLAYGTRESLEASVHLLNRYFPAIDITSVKAYQSPPYEAIQQFYCQSETCRDCDPQKQAVKVCVDPVLCANHTESAPPYYVCQGCFAAMNTSLSDLFLDVLQPVALVSQVCDNEDCRFGFMKAIYFCFSLSCTSKNNNIPIRLCEDCHSRLHANLTAPHMNHECLKELWITPDPTQSYMVDAIVRLWSEAEPDYKIQCAQMDLEVDPLFANDQMETMQYLKKIFRSLHGLWLLKTTCPIPPPNTFNHLDHLGRLFAMLLVWVESAGYATHAKVRPIVEQSMKQAITWINKVSDFDQELYCSCLQPDPPMFARVGHPWNMLTSVVRKNLEILQRLVSLNEHRLLPESVWDQVMPVWINEIKTNTPPTEIMKFKKILQHLFDIKSSERPSYAINFIRKNLESTRVKQSQEALVWVQLLSHLDCEMELEFLLETFIEMIILKQEHESIGGDAVVESAFPFPDVNMMQHITELEGNTSCQGLSTPLSGSMASLLTINDDLSSSILILDVLIKQLTLRKASRTTTRVINVEGKESTSLSLLLLSLVEQPLEGHHSDHNNTECRQCKLLNIFFYQINSLITLSVKQQVTIDKSKTEYSRSISSRKNLSLKRREKESVVSHSGETFSSWSANKLKSADVNGLPVLNEEVFTSSGDQLDSSIDTVVNSTYITANETDQKISNGPVDEDKAKEEARKAELQRQAELTKKALQEKASAMSALPELQLMEELLQQLPSEDNSSVVIYILGSINVLCLRGECLRTVAFNDKDLLHRLQTKMILPCLWNLLKSSNSNMAMEIMPIMLHCACLEYGAETICSQFEKDFTSSDWKVRFAAVEKVGLMCQFLTSYIIRHPLKQSVIVHGITFLVLSTEDVVMTVANKAKSLIQSIKITSLTNIYTYLDEHFKEIPEDRLALLSTYRMLHLYIRKHTPLTLEKFLTMLKITKDVQANRSDAPTKSRKRVLDTIPIYSRKITTMRDIHRGSCSINLEDCTHSHIGTVTYNPLMYYRNMYTLQEGKAWRDGRRPKDGFKGRRSEVNAFIDNMLDPVAEETEDEFKRISAHNELTITGEKGSLEDEVVTVLITMLVEFLSIKSNVEEKDKDTIEKEIEAIVDYMERTIGIGESSFSLGKEGLNNLRKNPVFVVFMMNLPQLLDGNKYYASLFVKIAIDALETCIKGINANNIINAKPSLCRLDDLLQNAWLTSLICILYKHSYQAYSSNIWELMNIAKSLIDGHGEHKCHIRRGNETMSMSTLIGLKMKGKVFRKRNMVILDKLDNSQGPGSTETPDNDIKYQRRRGGPVVIDKLDNTFEPASPEPEEREMKETNFSTSKDASASDWKASHSTTEYQDYIGSTEEHILHMKFKECPVCQTVLFQYKEDIINLSITALLTYIHVDPEAAAPFILDVIQSIARKSFIHDYFVNEKPTQQTAFIAQQALRCIYVQLAPKRLFPELFREKDLDDSFFITMASVLQEFKLLSQIHPIRLCLQDLEKSRNERDEYIHVFLENLAKYMRIIMHNYSNQWNTLQEEFDDFLKYIPSLLPNNQNSDQSMDCLLDIMSMLLVHQRQIFKLSIDSIEDCMTHIIKNCVFTSKSLQELCAAAADAFVKEDRNHTKLTKKVCLLLTMMLSAKICLPDYAVINMIHFFCYDIGTNFHFVKLGQIVTDFEGHITHRDVLKSMDCIDLYFANETIEYLKMPARRLKEFPDNSKNTLEHSTVKLSIAQLLAAHIAYSSVKTGSRICSKLMVLLDPPSDPQESPDVHEIVTHFRTFSWILLGALNHSNSLKIPLTEFNLFPLSKAAKIFEYIDGIIDILVKSDKETVRKSKSKAQFHIIFLLAEIWTVYVEQHTIINLNNKSQEINPMSVVKEFWSQLTPMLYLFVPQQKMQNETIHLFVKLMMGLSKQCPLTFTQLSPLWMPMLNVYADNIPDSSLNSINAAIHGENNTSETPKESLSRWIMEMQKELWGSERMLKGKIAATV